MSELEPGQQLEEASQTLTDEPAAETSGAAGVRLPRQLSALRHRNYRLFFSGQIISVTGMWLQQVVRGWLVLQLTNSALMLGVVGSISTLPILLFSLPAGVAVDRLRKRSVLLTTQTTAMFLAFTLAALVYFEVVTVYHIMVVGFILGVVHAFDMPTRQSFVIEMVGRKDLMNALSLNSATFNSARIVGPALAGIVIAAMGIAGAFFLNGVSFIAIIVGLLMIRVNHAGPAPSASMVQGLKEGLHFIRGHRMVSALLALTAVVSIFVGPYAVLMPIFARDILGVGPAGLGYLMSAVGIGALIGAVTLSSLGDFRAKGKLLLAGNLTCCTALILFASSRLMPLSLCLLVVGGWGMMTTLVLTNTLIQTSVPDHLRGRVLSAYTLMFLGMAPLGSLQAGVVANWLGAPAAVSIGAVVCAAAALLLSTRFTQHEG